MAASWVNFNNGDTGFAVRTALNTFNTAIALNMSNAEGRLDNTETATGTNITNIGLLDGRVGVNEQDIDALQEPETTRYVPQAVKPTPHVKGQLFYSDECQDMCVCTDIPDTHISLGQMSSMRVTNNTGVVIYKGEACTYDGAAGGYPLVKLAIADSFRNAIVLGVALHDIPAGDIGFIVTHGKIWETDTLGLTAGVPIYLSDTVAGAWTETPGNIITQIGGATQIGEFDGKFFVNIRSNVVLPTVFGRLHGAPVATYNLTVTPQDVLGYINDTSIVLPTNKTSGTITASGTGIFRTTFTATFDFTSATITRTIYFEIYNVTKATIIGHAMAKNVPRDATEDSCSFSFPIDADDGDVLVMRVSSTPNMDIDFTAVSFDVESISVR